MLDFYYRLPTKGTLCTVDSGTLSHDYLVIFLAYSSFDHATTRLMVHACAQLVLWEYQHTLSIVLTRFCLTIFCLTSLSLVVNCACAHKTVRRYDGAPPQMFL